jgi:hypothetical protein
MELTPFISRVMWPILEVSAAGETDVSARRGFGIRGITKSERTLTDA